MKMTCCCPLFWRYHHGCRNRLCTGWRLYYRWNRYVGGTDPGKISSYSVAQIVQLLDGLIVVAGATVFGIRTALYALIAIFCLGKVADSLIRRNEVFQAGLLFPDKYKEISDTIMTRMNRGVTGIAAKGMYSDEPKYAFLCCFQKRDRRNKRNCIRIRLKAFFIVSDAREVFGEGFIEDKNQLT